MNLSSTSVEPVSTLQQSEVTLQDLPIERIKQKPYLPYQSVNIQIGLSDILHAAKLGFTAQERDRNIYDYQIQMVWTHNMQAEKVLVVLCVRAAFDLYLQARNYPKGSEILMTGINIPDMVQIVREHGLVPVPVELDLVTMAPPSLDAIKEKVNPKTKAIVMALLYGLRWDVGVYADYLDSKGIDILEDVAQSFAGPQKFNGSPRARATFFSLGLIKIQTCISGGIAIIRNDEALYDRMHDIQESYPLQTKQMYFKKTYQAVLAYFALNTSLGSTTITHACHLLGMNREDMFVSMVRGFKPGDDFLGKFRVNPSTPLLKFILERMKSFDYEDYDNQRSRFQKASEKMHDAGVYVPGVQKKDRGFWLFPILVENKHLFINYLLSKGVIAYYGATQLRYVKPDAGYPDASHARWFFDHLLYLPVHPSVTDKDLNKIVDRVIETHNSITTYFRSGLVAQPTDPLHKKYLLRSKL